MTPLKQSLLAGALTGAGGDAKSPCEWILETSPGKGVEIDIEQITGATADCATNYLEVGLKSVLTGPIVIRLW